ncbi:MAG TPA: Bax inhibitor-1/YccA family protein, partial [Mycobacteriales bacterium]|nr:Bax inhibitor-1/YccA family protein [Mycobacteriales bacterium]
MESRNPVFNNSNAFSRKGYATFNDAPTATAGQLEDMYAAPAATGVDTGRMTIDDVVVKTGLMFAVLLPLAAAAYFLNNPILTFGGAIAGLVLGLVVSFKQSTNPALILSYAAAEGLFIGGISRVFEDRWPGIVATAVVATLCVFAVTLAAYKSGKVRATPKFKRTVLIAMGGYLVFCLVNLVVMLFGGGGDFGL